MQCRLVGHFLGALEGRLWWKSFADTKCSHWRMNTWPSSRLCLAASRLAGGRGQVRRAEKQEG